MLNFKIFTLLLLNLNSVLADNDSDLMSGSSPGAYLLSSVDEELKSVNVEMDVPWPGFAAFDRDPPPALYGLTYFPWRTSANCSNITLIDIENDIRMISKVAGSIYISELFCDFGPHLINLTRQYQMTILIGISIDDEFEYERQRKAFEHIFLHSNMNLSHVVAVAVGHDHLASIVNGPNSTKETEIFIQKLINITSIVDLSAYPDIPVSTADSVDYLFRRSLNRYEQIYIGTYNTMLTKIDPIQSNYYLYDSVFQIRNRADAEDNDHNQRKKSIIITDIGWASRGSYDFTPRDKKLSRFKNGPNIKQAKASDQAKFVYLLRCPNPKYMIPPMYYVQTAFDLTWKNASENDSSAFWGLADAVSRQWKPGVLNALNHPCSDEPPPDAFDDEQKPGSGRGMTSILIGVCTALGIVFIIMLGLVVCFWRWKREAVTKLKRTQQQQLELFRNISTATTSESDQNRYLKDVAKFGSVRWDDYLNMLEPDCEDLSHMVAPDLRIDLSRLELKEIIGEGHFGIVQKAKYNGDNGGTDVAVKRLHVGARNAHQFLQEGIKMQKFNHPNVLNLIGISFTPTNMPLIITPYLDEGDVLHYIKKRQNKDIPLRQLLNFCSQIAEGMRYLHELKMIHRDLAARNCMLDKHLTVKIADFGLCRDINDTDSYQTTKAFELPIRWMPPEAIEKLQWNSKSDVWSYGVVVWELLSRGRQPYGHVPLIELRVYLKNGGRLEQPGGCPDIVYEIMKSCWAIHERSRPSFADLSKCLPILLRALEKGENPETKDYYNLIMPLITSSQSLSNNDQVELPDSPGYAQSTSATQDRIKDRFRRGMMSLIKRKQPFESGPAVSRKNSLP